MPDSLCCGSCRCPLLEEQRNGSTHSHRLPRNLLPSPGSGRLAELASLGHFPNHIIQNSLDLDLGGIKPAFLPEELNISYTSGDLSHAGGSSAILGRYDKIIFEGGGTLRI